MIKQIRPGLKRWARPHPEFNPMEGGLDESYADVASALFDGVDSLALIDPLVPNELWPELDAEVERSGTALKKLLELPVEVVLPAHGDPVLANGHEALARALAA